MLLVFIGGGCGALARYGSYLLSIAVAPAIGQPAGTLSVNLLGSFLIGLSAPYFLTTAAAADLRLFFVTGLLGGFTTFSAFSFEVVELVRNGSPGFAAAYVLLSICGGLLLAFIGFWLRN